MNDFKNWLFPLHIILIAGGIILPSEFIGYVITAIIIFSTLYSLKNSLSLLFVLFPLRPFIVEINGGLAYLPDLIVLTIVLIIIFTRKYSLTYWFREYRWAALFILLLTVGLLSGLQTGITVPAGIFQIRSLTITLLLIVIGKEILWSRTDLNRIILVSIGTALVISVHGLIEKLSLRNWLLPASWKDWNLAAANEMRIYGLIANPNVLATYLIIVFFSTYLLKNTWLNSRLLVILRIVLAGTALLTYSRGAILAFTLGAVVYIILRRTWKHALTLLFYAFVSFSLIYYPVVLAAEGIEESGYFDQFAEEKNNTADELKEKSPDPVVKENNVLIERFKEMFSNDTIQASAEWGRIYVVLKGIEIFSDHPMFGSGFSTYGDAAAQTYESPLYEEYGIPNHLYTDNQYISLLVSTGVTGVVLASSLLFLLASKLLRVDHTLWRSISLSALVILLTSALFYNILEDKTFTLYFYFMIGYVLNNKINLENCYEMD
ncbi:O-antigen ligase [Halobacillus sp. A5]|uniref:O-antigen ligase family protein n=1 Tax=Halobacillus sp. A5 TaxID=2880263 RepID=UPI0020A677BC|nr:O-antigen ligase family protein [Halobacillus sp. A5]MCP3028081.1 O-antigen ligase family protein [Halobacillus sp. A5]